MIIAHGGWFMHSMEMLLLAIFISVGIYAIFFAGRAKKR